MKSLLFATVILIVAGLLEPARAQHSSAVKTKQKVVKATGYKPLAESDVSKNGKRHFESNHCNSCHSIGSSGGCLGPVLTGVGARRQKDFLTARITADKTSINKFEKLYGAGELLPHPRVPAAISKQIVEYLLTLPEPKSGYAVGVHSNPPSKASGKLGQTVSSADSLKEGKKLVYDKGCIACHSVNGVGGQFAIPFDGIGTRRNREFIEQRINNSENLIVSDSDEYGIRGVQMPPLNLTESEIRSIVNYLLSLKQKQAVN